MFCKWCGAECDDSESFCGKCGATRQREGGTSYCTNCGRENAYSSLNCSNCGTPLAAVAVPQALQVEGFRLTKPMVVAGIGAVGMVLTAIGSALPWATASALVFTVNKGGLSGDGIITLILAIVGLVFFAVGVTGMRRWAFVVGLVLSVLIVAVGIFDAVDVTRMASGAPSGASVSVGIGLVLCIIGGIVGLGAAIGGLR